MKDPQMEQAVCDANLAVLANVIELGSLVVLEVAGNDISNTVEGQLVTSSFLQESVAAHVNAAITPNAGDR